MTANLTMETDKRLAFAEMFDIYQYELEADTLQITVPRYYGTQDLSQTECRICFALGKQGDYGVLRQPRVTEETVVYQYTLGGTLTSHSGEYQLWLEFYIFDPTTHLPAWHLCSEMKKVKVQAHKHGEQLFTPTQMTYLEDLTTQFHTLQDTAEAGVANASQKANQALQKADQAAQTVAQNTQKVDTVTQSMAQTNQRVDGMAQTVAQNTQKVDGVTQSMGQLESEINGRLSQCFVQGTQTLSLQHTALSSTDTQNLRVGNDHIVGEKYSLTFGSGNESMSFAGLVGGVQNVALSPHQTVLGEGNTAPGSRNLAVFGQFCDTAYTNAAGQTLESPQDATRPLLLVGNGSSPSARNNAFAVYADGEAVLFPQGDPLPIGQTLAEQNTALQDHSARLAQLERGAAPGYSAGVGNVEDYLHSSDLKWYDGTWSVGGYQLTRSEEKEGFRTFLTAWEQDNTAVMYLDLGATVVSSQVSRLPSPPCEQTSWGYLIYFPGVNLTVCVTANELSGTTLVPTTLATAQNLCILLARGNGFAAEDMRSITALEGKAEITEATQELFLDLGEAERKAASAGKRIFGISFYYMLGDAVEETTPIYPVSCFGKETLLAKGAGLSLRREVQGLVANIAPDLFGWSYWLDYEDGASLQYRLELI